MFILRAIWLVVILAIAFQSGRAQGVLRNGLYQITSGSYTECCGVAGERDYSLPSESQTFVNIQVGSSADLASMTFLGLDQRTVFIAYPCPDINPISFSFDYGFISSNQIFFHVDPGPPPDQKFWSYTVDFSTNTIRINGLVGVSEGQCADVPNRFSHSDVTAVWVSSSPVLIDRLERDENSFRFHFTGEVAYDYTIEYSDPLMKTNWTVLNTYRAKLQPIDIIVTNSFTNSDFRLFRVRKDPCYCR